MIKKIKENNLILSEDKKTYIIESIKIFLQKEKYGFETRYKSWIYCHSYFMELKKCNGGKKFKELNEVDKKLSLLNLSGYLASWGMYRGSSFTLQYD